MGDFRALVCCSGTERQLWPAADTSLRDRRAARTVSSPRCTLGTARRSRAGWVGLSSWVGPARHGGPDSPGDNIYEVRDGASAKSMDGLREHELLGGGPLTRTSSTLAHPEGANENPPRPEIRISRRQKSTHSAVKLTLGRIGFPRRARQPANGPVGGVPLHTSAAHPPLLCHSTRAVVTLFSRPAGAGGSA